MQAELDDAGQAAFDRNRAMIDRLARLSEVTAVDALPKGAVTSRWRAASSACPSRT
jgi:valyl-tRNA synthetase